MLPYLAHSFDHYSSCYDLIYSYHFVGCEVEEFKIDVPCVDTHRQKPEVDSSLRSLDY